MWEQQGVRMQMKRGSRPQAWDLLNAKRNIRSTRVEKPGTYYKIFKIERTELVILRLWQQNGTVLSLLIPSIFYIDYTTNLILTPPIKY